MLIVLQKRFLSIESVVCIYAGERWNVNDLFIIFDKNENVYKFIDVCHALFAIYQSEY